MELTKNPFYTLSATTRDNRRRIQELAEEKALTIDEGVVREASATLTNPRKRLGAELGWLPGLGPRRITQVLSALATEPHSVRELENVPTLARANLLAEGFATVGSTLATQDIVDWTIELAAALESVDADEAATLVNEDRAVAGYPAISDLTDIEPGLREQQHYFRQVLIHTLDKLPTRSLIEVVTAAVDEATRYGTMHAPILIDDLVDAYEVRAKDFLEKEGENITGLVQQVRDAAASSGDNENIVDLATVLDTVVTNWDAVAQPIQVSSRSRGTDHGQSHEVAAEIRSLAVELNNQHGLIEVSRMLNAILQRVFAEVDKVVEQSEEDAAILDDLAVQRTNFLTRMELEAESWKNEITYQADVGAVVKKRLQISPDGVSWQGRQIALENITRVRWGGMRHSVNGIPSGTRYTVVVASEGAIVRIELRKENTYSEFVERLWKAAGVRLLTEMLEGLRGGGRYSFGKAVVTDYGIELEERRVFGANTKVPCKWTELRIGQRPGAFYIAKNNAKKVDIELPYQEIDNVHILEAAMRTFWKRSSHRMSDLLERAQ